MLWWNVMNHVILRIRAGVPPRFTPRQIVNNHIIDANQVRHCAEQGMACFLHLGRTFRNCNRHMLFLQIPANHFFPAFAPGFVPGLAPAAAASAAAASWALTLFIRPLSWNTLPGWSRR